MPEPPADPTRTAPEPVEAAPVTATGSTASQQPGATPAAPDDALRLGPPTHPGDLGRFGRYRVLSRLGAGGMGVVYLGHDVTLDRRVALKAMLPKFAALPVARARFLREARTAAQVRSEHVVAILDVDEVGGTPFIAMEYLQGVPLDRYLSGNPGLNPAQVIRFGMEAARGLAAAHEKGLIHRDIKPANLFLEAPHGRVKILDFGLAKEADPGDDGDVTRTGQVVGTPAYMSPEQARGAAVDHRTDLFSLGVVLYKLCTGRQPFTGPNPMAVVLAIGMDEPKPVRERNPDVPEALAALIHRLMAKKPADRPQSASEVHAALVAIETELTVPEATAVEGEDDYVPIAVAVPDPDAGEWVPPAEAAEPPSATAVTEAPGLPARRGFPWAAVGIAVLAVLALALLAVVLNKALRKPRVTGEAEPTAPWDKPDAARLFNGTDLDGWDAAPGWRVENGELVGTFPRGAGGDTAIVSRQAYRDFELSFQFRLTGSAGAGAGVGLRIPAGGRDEFRTAPGCEFGVASPDFWIGPRMVRTADAAARGPVRQDMYHLMVVKCVGRAVTVTVDRQTAHSAEFIIPLEGRVGWAVHLPAGEEAELRIRNVRFKELSPIRSADPDRETAALVVTTGGSVRVVGSSVGISTAAAIPTDSFRIRSVWLPITYQASDGDIDLLADLTDLERITVRNGKVTPAGLERLSRFPAAGKYTAVLLPGVPLSEETAAHYGRFASLRAVGFTRSTVTAAGLLELNRRCPNITSLSLEWVTAGDAELAALKEFKQLTALTLTHATITPAGLRHLADLPAGLRELDLRDIGWTDADLAEVERFPHLTTLGLQLTNVTDAAAVRIAETRGLKRLYISAPTPVATADRIAGLREKLPGCWVGTFPPRPAVGMTQFRHLDQAWVAAVAKMTPPEQIEAVGAELARRNPGFDPGTLTATITPTGVEGLKLSPRFVSDLTPVRALPVLARLDCDTDNTGLGSIADLNPLEGLPLRELRLHHNIHVADLSPLAGMPLETLDLSGCHAVTDLAPLRHTAVRWLNLDQTTVTDLTPLAGTPLRYLWLNPTRMKSLAPLARCPQLEALDFFDPHLLVRPGYGLDELRTLPNLKAVAKVPVTEFWPGWDRRKDAAKLPGPWKVLAESATPVACVAFDAKGERLAAVMADAKVVVWDAGGRGVQWTFDAKGRGHGVAFVPGTDFLAVTCDHGLMVWDLATGKPHGERQPPSFSFRGVSAGGDGRFLAANPGAPKQGIGLYTVKPLDPHTWRWFGESAAVVEASAFTPDGKFLATAYGFGDSSIRVWDVEKSAQAFVLSRVHYDGSTDVSFSADGRLLLYASHHGAVGLIDWRAKKEVKAFRWFGVTSAAFGPGGKHVILGGRDGVVTVLDAEAGKVVAESDGGSRVARVAVSPDGKTVATAHDDGKVRLWDWDALLGTKP